MVGPVACRASRLPSYSGSPARSLCRAFCRPGLVGAIVLGLMSGGCAMTGHLEGLFGGSKDDPKAYAKAETQADTTGSIAAKSDGMVKSHLPPDGDLAIAKAAAADVLARGGKDTSAAWENPRTGARGTVTPIATAYSQDGITCRDFLASHVRAGTESWMQGEACRADQGKWEVKSLRPWKRS